MWLDEPEGKGIVIVAVAPSASARRYRCFCRARRPGAILLLFGSAIDGDTPMPTQSRVVMHVLPHWLIGAALLPKSATTMPNKQEPEVKVSRTPRSISSW